MTWTRFLFSPTGRINRARYWGALAIQYGTAAAIWVPVAILDNDETKFDEAYPILTVVYLIVASAVTLLLIVSHVFAQVKRFHDRDKSWPWIFIGFVPYIGGIWVLVECGMLRGTVGRNRFGPDPLGNTNDIADIFGPPETGPLPRQPETL